jgi:glutathione S-transferase
MLKILGRKNSINVMKVLWASEELGLPFDRVDIGGEFKFQKQPNYLELNPNGRVPTIEDDGFVLWESNVIVRYLATKYGGGRLLPQGQSRWVAEQWMDWQQTIVSAPMSTVFWQLVRTAPEKRDAAAIDNARKTAAEQWKLLDQHLGRQPFVAGMTLTMGDIPVGAMVHRWFALPLERPSLPHLKAWYDRLTERQPYRTHIMIPMT